MAKVYFGKTVKYQGITYPPGTQFEVKDEDVNDLKLVGAWIVEPKNGKESIEEEKEVEEKSELEILREKAEALGIEYKGNWGVKRLTEAIAEIEEA